MSTTGNYDRRRYLLSTCGMLQSQHCTQHKIANVFLSAPKCASDWHNDLKIPLVKPHRNSLPM